MCRYAMSIYKPHYACFSCRKTFKRKLLRDLNGQREEQMVEAKCPQCGELMANMGLDFEAPKQKDQKQWEHIRDLYTVGITYHSCGCYGPGYIPKSSESLISYFQETLKRYQVNLEFYRKRIEPKTEKEHVRDEAKNWNEITKIPYERRPEKGSISNQAAKDYWIERIQELEGKLEYLLNKPRAKAQIAKTDS